MTVMPDTTTRITIAVQTNEVRTYELEGDNDEASALAEINSGMHQPVESDIRSEDIDVLELKVVPA